MKRTILSVLLIFGISVFSYAFFLLNPSFSYDRQTQFGQVTVFHMQELEAETEIVLRNAIEIIKDSELFSEEVNFQLCLNDGSRFPNLHPSAAGIAYSFLNKSIIYHSTPDFQNNRSHYTWKMNNDEQRSVDLTWLIAHEFTHNLQFNHDLSFMLKVDFWQQEGYAEYISRQWKNDGRLKEKVKILQEAEQKEHEGIPVIRLADGTIQMLSYFKYGLLVQYLCEQEGQTFGSICKDDKSMEEVYALMIAFAAN